MKHKWHKEIKAWADGAVIEYFSFGSGWQITNKPEWLQESEYRIKPQPKEPQYLYVLMNTSGRIEFHEKMYPPTVYIGKIKLEVDDD
jgi:hypothetical protein